MQKPETDQMIKGRDLPSADMHSITIIIVHLTFILCNNRAVIVWQNNKDEALIIKQQLKIQFKFNT